MFSLPDISMARTRILNILILVAVDVADRHQYVGRVSGVMTYVRFKVIDGASKDRTQRQ